MNTPFEIQPHDRFNQELIHNTHPADYSNPVPAPKYNTVVIGAGTAGLVTAAGSAGLGAKVALIEKNLMGGDCLNWGCVPSKGIIRSARSVADVKEAHRFGVHISDDIDVDFAVVMERMRKLRTKISHHDSVERFSDLGIDVFLGDAKFIDANTIQVGDSKLHFKKAVIATGARAFVPPIPGLEESGYLTNETIFQITELPKRLLVIGAGPIGCELAQSFQRFGSKVTIIEKSDHIMPREDSDAAEIVQDVFQQDGINLILNSSVERVSLSGSEKIVHYKNDGDEDSLTVDEILVSVGRSPNVEGMDLDKVDVDFDQKVGIQVNEYLQTTTPHIYAVGDVCMKYKFTHAADAAARVVIRNTLFPGNSKMDGLVIPWCTYTDPEVAHVGFSETDAIRDSIEIETFKQDFDHVDRAILDEEENGFVKVHVKKGSDKIVGATIVARHAGDMINEITMAMVNKIGLGKIGSIIHPYPTQAEAIRKVSDAYNRTKLTLGRKKLLSKWFQWMRT
jgi:dihydrolipoamide dehydrogenase